MIPLSYTSKTILEISVNKELRDHYVLICDYLDATIYNSTWLEESVLFGSNVTIWRINFDVQGDVLIKIMGKCQFSNGIYFRVSFNTFFLDGDEFILSKKQLDQAFKQSDSDKFPDYLALRILFAGTFFHSATERRSVRFNY